MRNLPKITALWNKGGPFVGANGKPNSRVTVQGPWPGTDGENVIFAQSNRIGDYRQLSRGFPVRWFQKADNSQTEIEVPNISTIEITRSDGDDAATCRIEMFNQWMYDNGETPTSPELGQPGYFTFSRGDDMSARARWGHQQNPWNNLLVPNALLRTYQGYGGFGKTITQSVADGDLVLTGVWLVDTVNVSTRGLINIDCRDTMKFLIDQELFPPLVPQDRYPLKYFRYRYRNRNISSTTNVYKHTITTPTLTDGDVAASYYDSSADRWYGTNADLYGHRGTDSIDGNTDSYALSVGNSGPDKPFATEWWEYTVGDYINSIYVHPWAGDYEMYISVLTSEGWQGSQYVPHDITSLYGTQERVVDAESDIPYIAFYNTPYETGQHYPLPRTYLAERVRISFRHLYDSGLGQFRYRAGIREFRPRVNQQQGSVATVQNYDVPPINYASDMLRDYTDLNRYGYMTVNMAGQVDVFGDCREANFSDGDPLPDPLYVLRPGNAVGGDQVSSVSLMPKGDGYRIMYFSGRVRCYGSADFHGSALGQFDPSNQNAVVIMNTPSGDGYWIINNEGTCWNFGDAQAFENFTPWTPDEIFLGGCVHPGPEQGIYVVESNGRVHTRGTAIYRGNWNKSWLTDSGREDGVQEVANDIAVTPDGSGYWVMSSVGAVQGFGSAQFHGQNPYPDYGLSAYLKFYNILPSNDGEGYILADGDGKMLFFGDILNFGMPIPGTTAQIRYDGNYYDYADIIKDLVLWGGFFLQDEYNVTDSTPVYGNIESTGSFAPEPLPDEIFDKRPIIDAITELKEAVGYSVWVDDEGAFRFESPNWWQPGNFFYDGTHTDDVLEIDERKTLIDYSIQINDQNLRSKIIIGSEDPTQEGATTVWSEFIPNTAQGLRGILKPAMWINGFFMRRADQQVMAQLIALHIWFSQRQGSVTIAANPAIGINDQVRIYERVTGDSYLHYVRGVTSRHDLTTGAYTMTLNTHWLGDGDEWAITTDESYNSDLGRFVMSPQVYERLSARYGLDSRKVPSY